MRIFNKLQCGGSYIGCNNNNFYSEANFCYQNYKITNNVLQLKQFQQKHRDVQSESGRSTPTKKKTDEDGFEIVLNSENGGSTCSLSNNSVRPIFNCWLTHFFLFWKLLQYCFFNLLMCIVKYWWTTYLLIELRGKRLWNLISLVLIS